MQNEKEAIISRFEDVAARIKNAPAKFYTASETVPGIIAVSKTHDKEKILPLLRHGHRVFGENRVQEAQKKWPELKQLYPDVKLHLIGPLQSNKVKEAVALFDVIETLDRPKLAAELKKIKAAGQEMCHQPSTINHQPKTFPQLYIQVNTGEEAQKAGVLPKDADGFIKYCRDELQLPVTGLMCIPPVNEEPSLHFGLLKNIAMRNEIKILSMGMSGDFEVAAAMGATYVRVGSAIFGERDVLA